MRYYTSLYPFHTDYHVPTDLVGVRPFLPLVYFP